jgi:AcrR family transcriptional regulator
MPRDKNSDPNGDKNTPVEADWIAEARQMLIDTGVASVQIKPLAERLGVTRGGFYWRFRNRQDLLDHLLDEWDLNNRALLVAAGRAGTPRERYRRLVRLWLEEREFDPALDTAIRQWAFVDAAVAERVRTADQARIDAITDIFVEAGQDPSEAMVRARIVYFHQVGYYALDMHETAAERRRLAPLYTHILAGFDD